MKTCIFTDRQIKVDIQQISQMVTIYAIFSFLPQSEGCSFWPNMQGEGNMVTAELVVDASTIKMTDYSDLTLLDGPKLSDIWQQQPPIKH